MINEGYWIKSKGSLRFGYKGKDLVVIRFEDGAEYITKKKLGGLLGLHPISLNRLINEGMPAYKVQRYTCFKEKEAIGWYHSRRMKRSVIGMKKNILKFGNF
jgi:hypothetical protein